MTNDYDGIPAGSWSHAIFYSMLRLLSGRQIVGTVVQMGITMNYGRRIQALTAETLAMETVISRVLARISQLDPILASAVRSGMDDAATKIGALAAKSCPATSPERVFKALAIIEALRAEMTMDLGK